MAGLARKHNLCLWHGPSAQHLHETLACIGKKDGSKNYAGVNSPVVDSLIETLIGAKTREELTTAIHALDRVLLWGHYVIPLYHSNTDRIAYWNFLEFPDEIPLYGLVIESWWANSEKASKLQR